MIGIFAHGKEETAGHLQELLDQTNERYRMYPLYETSEIPQEDLARLIILGGKMSVNDEKEFPWLLDEKERVRGMVAEGLPVLLDFSRGTDDCICIRSSHVPI